LKQLPAQASLLQTQMFQAAITFMDS